MEGELAVCCSEAEPEQLNLPVFIPGASGIHPGSGAAINFRRVRIFGLRPNAHASIIPLKLRFYGITAVNG